MNFKKKSISLTIKPTNSCNFRCKHCFNGEHLYDKDFLSVEISLKALELMAKSYQIIKLTFHGGEPTLAGKKYYQQIFDYESILEKKYGTSFHHIFQTNGFLLDDEFIEMLILKNTLISISFDGPHNDILRSNSEDIYKIIKTIQNKNGRLRVFCVETAKSTGSLFETYKWFNKNNINYKILPIQPRGFGENDLNLILNPNSYINELMDLYEYWLTDQNNSIIFYTFEEFLRLNESNIFKDFWFDRKLSLNSDGKFYPFGRPYDANFCLGNPFSVKDINECFSTEKYIELKKILKSKIDATCPKCKAYSICGGTCLCSSFVYGDNPKMLEYACNLAELTFTKVVEINKRVYNEIILGNTQNYSQKIVDFFLKKYRENHNCLKR